MMGLHPAEGICLNGSRLGTGEAGSNHSAERVAGFVAIHPSNNHPEVGAVHVLRYTAAAVVERSKLRLRGNVSLFGGAGEPANRLDLAQLHSLPGCIAKGERVLSGHISLLRDVENLLKGTGLNRCSGR